MQVHIVIATVTGLGALVIPRLFTGSSAWIQAALRLALLATLSFTILKALGSPFQPHFDAKDSGLIFWERIVEAVWWIVVARSAIGFARLMVIIEHRPRESQIISDLVAGAIYLAAVLAIVNFAFDVPVGGLLATSGIIAIVLGLALQSTLSDVFSGIAVGIERPYRAGDLLWVEGGIEGQVVQVNWRSTHVATAKGDVAIIPNSVIAKARLVNHSLPSPHRSSSIEVRLDPNVSPRLCMTTLEAAVQACLIPLPIPAPEIMRTGLQGDGAVYEISFSVSSSDELGGARNELFAEIQRHLCHAGIALAVVGLASLPPLAIPTGIDLLEQSDLFGVIDPSYRELLANGLTEVFVAIGDTLIRKDEIATALFIISSGAVEIEAEHASGKRVVHRMGPGGCLGAVGLITGSAYAATATALTSVKAYRLDKQAIAAAMAARPDLALGLEDLARRAQAAIRRDAAAQEDERRLEPEDLFLNRMRNFLKRLSAGTSASSPGP